MFRTIIIFVLVVAVIGGGLLVLRRSGRAGMPSEDVLHRATERARKLDAEDDDGPRGA